MAILVITGPLGQGKTLSLTYLAWRNWYYKRRRIFANYTLYGIPYFKITRVSELDRIKNGYGCFDEIWVWLEAAAGERLKKKIVSDILRKSRKRNLTIASTSQTLDQVPPRIRKIIDFIGYPILNRAETICKLLIFAGPKGRTLLRVHYFYTKPIFRMYRTEEEVGDLIDDVTGFWRKPISPRAQAAYEKEFAGLEKIDVKPIKVEAPIKISPEIRLTPKPRNITLEDAEAGSVGLEEEEELLEQMKG